jgi:hypothetical protein
MGYHSQVEPRPLITGNPREFVRLMKQPEPSGLRLNHSLWTGQVWLPPALRPLATLPPEAQSYDHVLQMGVTTPIAVVYPGKRR